MLGIRSSKIEENWQLRVCEGRDGQRAECERAIHVNNECTAGT